MKYFKRSNKQSRSGLIAVFLAGLVLAGCGGSGNPGSDDDEGIIGTGLLLKGTVSSESRLAENTVEVKSNDGIKSVAPVDSNGRYQSNSITGEAPYLIRANLGNNSFRYSIGYATGNQITQNLHSYTDAAARNWFSREGLNIDAEFNSDGPLTSMPTATQYNDTLSILANIVGPVQNDYGLSGVNIQSADFAADGTGLDRYLINNPVIVNNGQITIIINDPNSNVQSVATSNLSLSEDWAAADSEAPGTPDNVRVLQASANEAVVVWQPATDNIGVTAYRVFRDGIDVDLTPYPVFTDTGLNPGTVYTYSIVAVDAAGNESPATPEQTVTLSIDLDTVAPMAPLSLQLDATVSLVNISWQHPDISDVALFEVQRSIGNTTAAELVSVPSTFFTDTNVLAGTQYCYQIVAVDSAGNRSPVSQNSCATTSGNAVVTQEVEVTTPVITDPGPVVSNPTPNTTNCTTELGITRVEENTTIPAGCYLAGNITVADGFNLTISPNTTLKFAAGTRLHVGQGASLTADGRADAPIFFTAQDPTPGFWTGLAFVYSNSSRNILNHVTVEYGGDRLSANLEVSARSTLPVRINISNSTFRHSSNVGIEIESYSIVDTFTNNTLTSNEYPIKVAADVAPDLGTGSRFSGNTNDTIDLTGAFFSTSGTWQKQDVPYSTGSLTVQSDLSIAAGVTVEFASNARLYIGSDGSLSAVGTATDPVVLTGKEKIPGFWQGVDFTYSSSIDNLLEHVILEYGGTSANDDANLTVNSASTLITRLAMNNVIFRESLGDGFRIESNTGLSQFENITSTSNARTGVVDAQIAGSLGTGSVFTGNTEDVLVVESGAIDKNESWINHGVPYSVKGIDVSETNLVLSAGVELLMQSNSRIYVSREGSLTVAGTATNPVLITGAEPVPGSWRGIQLVYTNSTNNSIDNAVIRHGGIGTSNAANISLQCASTLPSRLSVSNTLIADSAAMGISSIGTGCELNVDSSVTFSNNAAGDI